MLGGILIAGVVCWSAPGPDRAPGQGAARVVNLLPFPDGRLWDGDGPGLLFGTELGAWPMLDQRYDGHPVLNYQGSCPDCPRLAREARISVVRWGIWNVFEGMTPPIGQSAPALARGQFDAVIDGIHTQLGARPLIKLQPGISEPIDLFCPETWGYANLLAMYKEVVAQAGRRVELYEIGNEPELACGYGKDRSAAGARAAQLWIQLAPPLRKYARTLGLNLVLGGPSFTTTHVNPRLTDLIDLATARGYMATVKNTYDDPASPYFHDPDLIPSFYSFHAYGIEFVINGGARPLEAVPRYGDYVEGVRAVLEDVWGPDLGPRIRIACTEWNYGVGGDPATWDPAEVSEYYAHFFAMLRQHRVWLANQYLLSSNGDDMDMITKDGQVTPAYYAFRSASLDAH
jgi:hypothetical protein